MFCFHWLALPEVWSPYMWRRRWIWNLHPWLPSLQKEDCYVSDALEILETVCLSLNATTLFFSVAAVSLTSGVKFFCQQYMDVFCVFVQWCSRDSDPLSRCLCSSWLPALHWDAHREQRQRESNFWKNPQVSLVSHIWSVLFNAKSIISQQKFVLLWGWLL